MNLRTAPLPLLLAALLAGEAWSGGGAEPAKPAAGEAGAPSARQDYDAIFSDILKSLPQEKRALVDSARDAKGNGNAAKADPKGPPTEEEKEKAREEAKAKRSKALEALPADVKARVDKAITDLDNRRKEKQAEFKELNK
jgi:cell pole-organizing protein PopZ